MMNIIDNITVNAQSSIRIDCGKVLRFDPFVMKEEPHDADVVFITHEHHDHFSPEDLKKVVKPETVYVAPASMKEAVEKAGIDASRVTFVRPNERGEILGIEFDTVPAYNRLKPFHKKSSEWVGYVLNLGGERVYIAGDTDGLKENTSLDIDVALIPIGGKFTMNADEAAEFINELKPKIVVPTHFGGMLGSDDADKKFSEKVSDVIDVVLKLHN